MIHLNGKLRPTCHYCRCERAFLDLQLTQNVRQFEFVHWTVFHVANVRIYALSLSLMPSIQKISWVKWIDWTLGSLMNPKLVVSVYPTHVNISWSMLRTATASSDAVLFVHFVLTYVSASASCCIIRPHGRCLILITTVPNAFVSVGRYRRPCVGASGGHHGPPRSWTPFLSSKLAIIWRSVQQPATLRALLPSPSLLFKVRNR